MAIDAGHARAGRQVSGEHAEGGGLSRAIWPQKPDNLTGVYLEGDVIHGGVPGEALGEVVNFYHGSTRNVLRMSLCC